MNWNVGLGDFPHLMSYIRFNNKSRIDYFNYTFSVVLFVKSRRHAAGIVVSNNNLLLGSLHSLYSGFQKDKKDVL